MNRNTAVLLQGAWILLVTLGTAVSLSIVFRLDGRRTLWLMTAAVQIVTVAVLLMNLERL